MSKQKAIVPDFTISVDDINRFVEGDAIRTSGVIKTCKITEKCAHIDMRGLQLTGDEYKRMTRFIQKKEALDIIIIPSQGDLFEE